MLEDSNINVKLLAQKFTNVESIPQYFQIWTHGRQMCIEASIVSFIKTLLFDVSS